MRTYIDIFDSEPLKIRTSDDGPKLIIDSFALHLSWEQFEQAKNEMNRAWYAFQEEEQHRQAEADIDDEASRDGDRNHELVEAMGGAVV